MTGHFTEEGLIDDISDLSFQDYLGLEEWIQFYNEEYTYVGMKYLLINFMLKSGTVYIPLLFGRIFIL